MAKLLWLNWSGGGNLPPSLGIARVLTERGHQVIFVGRPEMVPRVEAAGFRAVEVKSAYAQVGKYPTISRLRNAACYLTSPACGTELHDIIATEAPDLTLIDAMFPVALAEARTFKGPTAILCHTFVFRMLEKWREMLGRLNAMRTQAGFDSLPGLDELWQEHDRLIVTTLGAFDTACPPGWDNVRHVGPVLEDEKIAVATALPWPDDDATPLVLISFSTGFEQRSVDKLQRGFDALADIPVRVVATTGGIVNPDELRVPSNAIALNYAAHDPILRRASLVVTHGGHGTAMRALRHGVPMIVIPGLAHDQAPNAATMQEWGVGLALPESASVDAIHNAARQILSSPSYRRNAQQRSLALADVDGAASAVQEIEAILPLLDGSVPSKRAAGSLP